MIYHDLYNDLSVRGAENWHWRVHREQSPNVAFSMKIVDRNGSGRFVLATSLGEMQGSFGHQH